MTVTTSAPGYLEGSYLEADYLAALAQGSMGCQALIVIQKESAYGLQSRVQIVDALKPVGLQSRVTIQDTVTARGMQASVTVVDALKPIGFQAVVQILDSLKTSGIQSSLTIADVVTARGVQASVTITDALKPIAMQARVQIVDSEQSVGIQAFVTVTDSLTARGMQVMVTITDSVKATALQALTSLLDILDQSGIQSQVSIVNYMRSMGFQVRVDRYPTSVCPGEGGYLEFDYLIEPYLTEIWCTRPGMQAEIRTNFQYEKGFQARVSIVDATKTIGIQSQIRIADALKPVGFQATVVRQTALGMQALATIYNTTNLRILCNFPSRGVNNTNWTANSTMAGDFSVQNLDTDVTEQVWRSNNVTSGINLTTDTGLPQGVFLDTLAILNHNLTKSALVTMLGSNDPTFSTVGVTITLEARLNNMFYIAPTLPNAGYRYWRFNIDDATNSSSYLEIGTLLFGAADIFQGECFIDQIDFELKDYSDTIRTEGFTNVTNSRSQKRKLKLEFQSLSFEKRNFTIMRDMFERDRTVNKCLWIPTPDATLQDVTARFAVYGKLSVIPTERHNNKGPSQDYVSFTADIDESL
jgi:D-ribose pyranose/furanose isomerase RbsD